MVVTKYLLIVRIPGNAPSEWISIHCDTLPSYTTHCQCHTFNNVGLALHVCFPYRIALQTLFIFLWIDLRRNYTYLSKSSKLINFSQFSVPTTKGQLISKGYFGVFKSTKKNNDFYLRISAMAWKEVESKK